MKNLDTGKVGIAEALMFASSVMGILAFNILLGYYAGSKLDEYFGPHNFKLLGVLLGLGTGFLTVYRMIRYQILKGGKKGNRS